MEQTEGLTSGRRTGENQFIYRRFCLRVVQGPDQGMSVMSGGEETTIGTDEGSNLKLTDRAVSRHHASIRATERGLELHDLGSKNGTVMGAHRVMVAIAQFGSLISCGRTVLRVEPSADEVGDALSPHDHFGDAMGISPEMRRVFALLERFAPTDGTVLLEGETGTGKEVLAQAIHDASPRAKGPFVVVDLGALSATLIESELFGHVRGAFTGAVESRRGALEAANGGTLFLDEIGEMPVGLQPLLLRALEDRSIRRIGEDGRVPIDVRIIAATNRDLRSEVNSGQFRADLYYRLAVLRVTVPPLRSRPADIPILIQHFVDAFSSQESGASSQPVNAADLVTALAGRSWPGNVRELRSAVERAFVFGNAVPPSEDVAPIGTDIGDPNCAFRDAKEQAMANWEQNYVRQLLARSGGNLAKAARTAKMSRSYLSKLVSLYGLRKS